MTDGPMPPDPFRAPQADWTQLASGNWDFFSAHLAAGFSEGQALHLTTQYLNTLLAIMMANAVQQDPGGV